LSAHSCTPPRAVLLPPANVPSMGSGAPREAACATVITRASPSSFETPFLIRRPTEVLLRTNLT
jgi:hypothetical protein